MAAKDRKQPTDEAMKMRALTRWEGEGGAPVEGRSPAAQRELNRRNKLTANSEAATHTGDTKPKESEAGIARTIPHSRDGGAAQKARGRQKTK